MRRFRIDFTRPNEARTLHYEKEGQKDEFQVFVPSTCKAVGVVFYDKSHVVKWLAPPGEEHRLEVFKSVEEIRALNDGNIEIRWEDPICFRCGATLEYGERVNCHCYGCGALQGKEHLFEDKARGH